MKCNRYAYKIKDVGSGREYTIHIPAYNRIDAQKKLIQPVLYAFGSIPINFDLHYLGMEK